MSTVAEIEHAIEKLPTKPLLEVGEWLDEPRAMLAESEGLFQSLDEEEGAVSEPPWTGSGGRGMPQEELLR